MWTFYWSVSLKVYLPSDLEECLLLGRRILFPPHLFQDGYFEFHPLKLEAGLERHSHPGRTRLHIRMLLKKRNLITGIGFNVSFWDFTIVKRLAGRNLVRLFLIFCQVEMERVTFKYLNNQIEGILLFNFEEDFSTSSSWLPTLWSFSASFSGEIFSWRIGSSPSRRELFESELIIGSASLSSLRGWACSWLSMNYNWIIEWKKAEWMNFLTLFINFTHDYH